MATSPAPGSFPSPASPDQGIWDRLLTRPIVAIPVVQGITTKVLVEGSGILIGWAFRETAAQATQFDLIDGRDTTGQLFGSNVLAASGGNAQSIGVAGSLFKGGLTLTVAGGAIKGAVWVRI